MAKKKKIVHRGKSLLKIASHDRGYKAAKQAEARAASRKKKAWKKAIVKAKRKLKK